MAYGVSPPNRKLGASHNPAYPEYRSWAGMRQRCSNPNNKKYRDYGARGITVCERWNSFERFYEDMGPKPSPLHSIDRVDVNGDYEPSNCRWATPAQQANNRRPKSSYRKRRKAPDGSLVPNSDMGPDQFAALLASVPGSLEVKAAMLHTSRAALRRYRHGTSIPQPIVSRLMEVAAGG